MKSLIVEGTTNTPEMVFNNDGQLMIKGKSIPASAWKVFSPAIYWVSEIDAENVEFHIDMEYINSSSVVMMLELLRILEANRKVKNIRINWHYEEGDESVYEIGQIMKESLGRSEFDFQMEAVRIN